MDFAVRVGGMCSLAPFAHTRRKRSEGAIERTYKGLSEPASETIGTDAPLSSHPEGVLVPTGRIQQSIAIAIRAACVLAFTRRFLAPRQRSAGLLPRAK